MVHADVDSGHMSISFHYSLPVQCHFRQKVISKLFKFKDIIALNLNAIIKLAVSYFWFI